MQDHRAKLVEGAHKFRCKGAHALNALDLGVQRGGGLEFEAGRGLVALGAENDKAALAARGQKAFHCRGFFAVALVRTAPVTGGKAHLHLGVHASGVAGIGVEIVGAAAQQEELERLFSKALGRRPRLEWPVGPLALALAGAVGNGDARIWIAAQEADKGRKSQVHALQALRAVDLLEQFKLEKQRLELRAGEAPLDVAHTASQLQAARMPGRGLEQTFQAAAQVGRAADIRFGVGFGAVKREDRLGMRQLGERGLGVGRIEGESLRLTRHRHPRQAPAMVMPSMRRVGEATAPRKTRSLPMALTFLSIPARLPAMVTSSTA